MSPPLLPVPLLPVPPLSLPKLSQEGWQECTCTSDSDNNELGKSLHVFGTTTSGDTNVSCRKLLPPRDMRNAPQRCSILGKTFCVCHGQVSTTTRRCLRWLWRVCHSVATAGRCPPDNTERVYDTGEYIIVPSHVLSVLDKCLLHTCFGDRANEDISGHIHRQIQAVK